VKKFPSGAAVEIFETLDSTSTEVKRRANAGEQGPLWIIALHQTAGYGRRARAWEQEAGDFAGTLLFKPNVPRESFGQISFVAALAVQEAISKLTPRASVKIKWPNDILVGGEKSAGILLEMIETPTGPALVLGIGVNMVSKPEGLPFKATRLLDHGLKAPPGPEDFARALDANFWAHYEIWQTRGFAPVRKAWLERSAGLGGEITARLPNETVSGLFKDIDETGALVLHSESGKRIISAGDVYFGSAEAGRIQDR
jgi:BirA family biotin operon repressor/biotin-[acetyl-CoA-carboxylase] ligase